LAQVSYQPVPLENMRIAGFVAPSPSGVGTSGAACSTQSGSSSPARPLILRPTVLGFRQDVQRNPFIFIFARLCAAVDAIVLELNSKGGIGLEKVPDAWTLARLRQANLTKRVQMCRLTRLTNAFNGR
jgi:hypothetical protein